MKHHAASTPIVFKRPTCLSRLGSVAIAGLVAGPIVLEPAFARAEPIDVVDDVDAAAAAHDGAEAMAVLLPLAERNRADAQFRLGTLYEDGRGVAKDDGEAARWYRRAAERGHAEAQASLAGMYEDGRGVPRDDEAALYWYRRAALQNDAGAQFALACLLEAGRGAARDEAEARRWYRRAAAQQHADAQFALGRLYASGGATPRDPALAYFWFDLAARSDVNSRAGALALIQRDVLAGRMTPAELAEARRLARERGAAADAR